MAYATSLHRIGMVLVSSALALSIFTTVFAHQSATDKPDRPLPIEVSHVFIPLVYRGMEVIVKREDETFVERASVESVSLVMVDTSPVQVNAILRGSLPDSCTQIDTVQQLHGADQISLKIFTRPRLDRRICAAVLTPFEETVPLHLSELAAGPYRVVVQNIQASFTLRADQIASNRVYLPLVNH